MPYPESPEHNKLAARKEEHETIQSFVDFIENHLDYEIMFAYSYPVNEMEIANPEQLGRLIGEFFDIDYDAYREEKQAMYDYIRAVANKEEGE